MTDMEDPIGLFDFSLLHKIYIPDQGLKPFVINENIFALSLESSNLDDLIEALSNDEFKASLCEAVNIVMMNIKIKNTNEHDNLCYVRKKYFCDLLNEDRIMFMQMCGEIWIKDKGKKGFDELKEFPAVKNFIEELEESGKFSYSKLKLSSAIKFISYNDELITSMIKLFKFSEQNEVDKKLFEAVAAKKNFETFQVMIKFHAEESNRIKKEEIYAFLLLKGYKVFKEKLTEEELKKVADEMPKYFHNSESLIQFLMSRSQIAMCSAEDEPKFLRKMKNYFENLNGFDDLQPILCLVDTNLQIIFDFNSDSVERSYPLESETAKGIFIPERMQIIVGAKNENFEEEKLKKRDLEIAGTLIHELAHFSMKKVFKNSCKPYSLGDDDQEEKFKKILKGYERETENFHDEIVRRVFNYKPNVQSDELIVRAPQMIATYSLAENENYLIDMKIKYKELFEYFNNFVLKSIENYLDPESRIKREVLEISKFDLKVLTYYPKAEKVNFDPQKKIHVLTSVFPEMVIWQLMKQLDKTFTITTTFNNFVKNEDRIFQTCRKSDKISLIVKFENEMANLDLFKELKKVFVVCSRQENLEISKALKKEKIDHEEIFIEYKFCDLKKESKAKVLENFVKFQGKEFPMKNIFDKNFEPLQSFPLENLTSHKIIEIGKKIERNEGYDENLFTKRILSYEENSNDQRQSKNDKKIISTEEIEKIQSLMSDYKLLLLSDHGGQGKSTVLTHLALNLQKVEPDQFSLFDDEESAKLDWIVKINLHLYAELFERTNLKMSDENLINFIFHNFAGKSKNDFEFNLFKDFIKRQKVIFIFDDFDEIAPFCDEKVKKLIKRLFGLKASNIFVATRPHLENEFEDFGEKLLSLNLVPFTREDQIKYLTNFLSTDMKIFSNISENTLTNMIRSKISLFASTLNESGETETMLSTPLHTYMMAQVLHQKIIESNYDLKSVFDDEAFDNLYLLFERFMAIIERTTITKKGDKITDELLRAQRTNLLSKKIDVTTNVMDTFKELAFQLILQEQELNLSQFDSKKKELMLRYGIISECDGKFNFVHRSFAEFLIAQSILETLIQEKLFESQYGSCFLNILLDLNFEPIRAFLDAALSIDKIYENITKQSLKDLGTYFIEIFKVFKVAKSPLQNFMHMIVENNKIIIFRLPKYFVFLAHLCLSSLNQCENENQTIQEILKLPWNGISHIKELLKLASQEQTPLKIKIKEGIDLSLNLKYPIYHEGNIKNDDIHGENLFHAACKINIKCIIEIVWELARKVFIEEELKKYFLTENTCNKAKTGVFDYNLHAMQDHVLGLYSFDIDFKLIDPKYFDTIENLRKNMRSEKLNFNLDENFDKSSTFLLIEIAKELKMSEDENLKFSTSKLSCWTPVEDYSNIIFYKLNVLLKVKKDLFNDQYHKRAFNSFHYGDRFNEAVICGIFLDNDLHHLRRHLQVNLVSNLKALFLAESNPRLTSKVFKFLSNKMERSSFDTHIEEYFRAVFYWSGEKTIQKTPQIISNTLRKISIGLINEQRVAKRKSN